jgi:ribosomal protein S27E
MSVHLDGNALAGPLAEVFAADVTTARLRCASCGDVAALARAMVYGGPMGAVVRCGNCDDVLLVFVQAPDHSSITMQGASWLHIDR